MRLYRRRAARYLLSSMAVLAVAPPGAALARPLAEEAPVQAGARVRLSAPSVVNDQIHGTVSDTDVESLVVSADGQGRLRVPWRSITQLQVRTGQRSHKGKGFLIGFGAGAALSIVLPKCVNEGCSSEATFDPTFAVLYGLIGGAVGAGIGAAVKTEEWTPVPLRVAVIPTRGRGVQVRISLAVK